MSRNGRNAKVELKLKLSLPGGSRTRSTGTPSPSSSSSSSSPRSCLSSEPETSPEPETMILAGCPRCLMYVMLAEKDPKCPKCKSAVLLDFFNHAAINNPRSRN